MKKTIGLALAIWGVFTVSARADTIPPEIASACAKEWGADYSMQVYCRNKQMEALRQLNSDQVVNSKQSPTPDEKGRVITCKFKRLPHIVINMTQGRETLIVGNKSFTVGVGSQFWSAGDYIIAFNGAEPVGHGMKVWAEQQSSHKQESAICR